MRDTGKDVRIYRRLVEQESNGNIKNHFNSLEWRNRMTHLEISQASPACPSNWSNTELNMLDW